MIPDNVEKIIMTKEDYDRNVEQLLYDKINAEQEVERLNNIINELEKYIGSKMNSFGVCNASDIYYKLQELKHKKIYGSVDSEIVYFGELGSDKE